MTDDEFSGDSGSFDREIYIETMKDDPPLKRYVSRGDQPDSIDIPGPHEDADMAIARAIRMTRSDGTPRLQPVLGSAGMGKTHLFWVLKEQEKTGTLGTFTAVYVPSPPAPVRVPLHFYACLVDEAGETLFERAADSILAEFGEKKGVIRHRYDFDDVMSKALLKYPGVAADVVKALLKYRLDERQSDLAKRWLLGEALSEEDLDTLDVRAILEEDDLTMAALKLMTE
ncbi:MAG: hypothetical protein HXY34_08805, partial [Candidatus Thorarchaeota archaeon]|nr:hypothetical protein [Candidatus Thorarchaeota archaeon]